jgi:tetratricopeptide (TPR) repeat protein
MIVSETIIIVHAAGRGYTEGMGPSKTPSRTAAERAHRAIGRLMREQKFHSVEDANRFLAERVAGRPLAEYAPAPEDPKERAQQLAFDAMDASSRREALRLSAEALAIDPENADALLIQAQHSGKTGEELIADLRCAVAAGERGLGTDFFEQHRGGFWGVVESRPYMRTRFELAAALDNAGRNEDAIAEFEALLDLNPNDNQGARDFLIGLYLSAGRPDAARELAARYEKDISATIRWGAVIAEYLAGDRGKAIAAFRRARKANRHFVAIASGRRGMPQLGPYYAPGSEEEAALALSFLGPAMRGHADLIRWLDQTNRKLV